MSKASPPPPLENPLCRRAPLRRLSLPLVPPVHLLNWQPNPHIHMFACTSFQGVHETMEDLGHCSDRAACRLRLHGACAPGNCSWRNCSACGQRPLRALLNLARNKPVRGTFHCTAWCKSLISAMTASVVLCHLRCPCTQRVCWGSTAPLALSNSGPL